MAKQLHHRSPRYFLFWGCIGLLELPLAYSFLSHSLFLQEHFGAPAFFCHYLAAVLAFLMEPVGKGLLTSKRFASHFLSLFVLFVPFLGWLLGGWLLFFKNPFVVSDIADDDTSWLVPREVASILGHSFKSRKQRVLEGLDFMPLADIMEGEDISLKRGAVERLSQMKSSEAIEVLMSYRGDASAEVRFYVTSALSTIRKELDEQLEALKKEVKKPDATSSNRLALAKVYLAYAQTKLADDRTCLEYEKEAIYHLNLLIETSDEKEEALWLLVSLFEKMHDWPKVLSCLDQISRSLGGDNEEVLQSKIKIFFETGKYDQIPQLFAKQKQFTSPGWQGLKLWWGVS